ncbi:MAG TPA: helix-turn-helix transcriptional regulator [Candidatus Rubneribacter avistercoris]|nr:helix-turn-helix transcriptional regulator [Candidatus Rubneribacter avistercoris]
MNRKGAPHDAPTAEALSAPAFALLVCGLGTYLGWQTVGISPTLFPRPQAMSAQVLELANYLQTALFLVLLAVLARVALRRGGGLISSRLLVLSAPALMCASTVCAYASGWVFDQPLGTVAGVALGASKAALLLLWSECLCRVRFRDALLCVALVYATAFSLCLLVAGLKPLPALIVHAVLPLLSGAALLALRFDGAFVALGSAPPREAGSASLLPLRLFVGVGLFGAVSLLTNSLSEEKSSATAELNTLIAGLAVSAIIALLARRRSGGFDFMLLYRMLTPLIIVSIIPVLTLESGNQQYEAFVIGAGWTFFRIFTWTLWCSIALRSRVPAATVFAAGQFSLTACSTLAQALYDGFLQEAGVSLPVTISGIIALAVAVSAFVMSEGDIRRFFERRKARRQPADDEEAFARCARRAACEFGLSNREEEIAVLVMKGKNNAVIEKLLCITESTLRTHLRNIYGKAGVHSRQELADTLASYLDDA